MALRTVLADKEVMFIEGVQAIFKDIKHPSIKVVGMSYSKEELSAIMMNPIDLLILDPSMDATDGFNIIAECKRIQPSIKIVVISHFEDAQIVKTAFLKGANGYVLKTHHTIELIQCVDQVIEGFTYLGEGLRLTPAYNKLPSEIDQNVLLKKFEDRFMLKQKLTKREREILTLIVQYKNNKMIAKELHISDQTASVHRKSIMKKFGVRSTSALIKFTLDHQLV
jgi:DNA-binding NarL/FixJ family response regulator